MPQPPRTRNHDRRPVGSFVSKPAKKTRFHDEPPSSKRVPAKHGLPVRDLPPKRNPREPLYDSRPSRRPKHGYRSTRPDRDAFYHDSLPPRRNPARGSHVPVAAASGAAAASAARPKSWRDFAREGFEALSDVAAVPWFKARDELEHDEATAKVWLSKDAAGKSAQKQDEDAKAAQDEIKEHAEAEKDGQPGIDKYMSAKRAVAREKDRMLETESEKYPSIIARRGEEGNPVRVREKSADRGKRLEFSQESNRGLGATLLGGAAGAYVGEHAVHGLAGSIGGALIGALGGKVMEKFGKKRNDEYEEDVERRQRDELETPLSSYATRGRSPSALPPSRSRGRV